MGVDERKFAFDEWGCVAFTRGGEALYGQNFLNAANAAFAREKHNHIYRFCDKLARRVGGCFLSELF